MERKVREDAEQAAVDSKEQADHVRSSYDTLFGYLQSIVDVYARAHMVRRLDHLYEMALQSIPDSPLESAESADVKTSTSMSSKDASTAS